MVRVMGQSQSDVFGMVFVSLPYVLLQVSFTLHVSQIQIIQLNCSHEVIWNELRRRLT